MKKPEPTPQEEADAMMLLWRDRLWLGAWSPSVVFEPQLGKSKHDHDNVAAECDADPAYKNCLITLSEKVHSPRSPGKKNRTICHEMSHVVLAEISQYVATLTDDLPPAKRGMYRKWWHEVNERTTQHWTNVMLDAFGELAATGQ